MEINITPIGDAESIGLSKPVEPQAAPKKPKKTKTKKATKNESVTPDMNVVFGGTCLCKDATLIEHYDFIQYKMNDVFENWNQLKKNCYFVFNRLDDKEKKDRFGLDMVKKDNYYLADDTVYDDTLIDFLKSTETKFDVLLLIEAHNLMEVFLENNEEERSLFDRDIKDLYAKVKTFYNSLKNNGIIVNIHYRNVDKTLFFCSLEHFYTTSSVWSLDVHLFLLKVMNQLFEKLESGIYQKKTGEIDIDKIIEDAYQETLEELFKIGSENIDEPSVIVDQIDKKYFKGNLAENKTYNWEKAIMHSVNHLIKFVLKSEEETE